MLGSLFNKVAGLKAWNFIKKTPAQVLSCEICENFKKTFFYRTPPVTASEQTQEISVVHLGKGFFGHLA